MSLPEAVEDIIEDMVSGRSLYDSLDEADIKDSEMYFHVDMTKDVGGTASVCVKANSVSEAKSKATAKYPKWVVKAIYQASDGFVSEAKRRGLFVC